MNRAVVFGETAGSIHSRISNFFSDSVDGAVRHTGEVGNPHFSVHDDPRDESSSIGTAAPAHASIESYHSRDCKLKDFTPCK